jgi:Domain of unknown function (DUF305)
MKLLKAIHSFFSGIVIPVLLELILSLGLLALTVQANAPGRTSQAAACYDWSEPVASMDKMHMPMGAIKGSGDSDVDFVRLMLPHHQAAIDIAKAQLYVALENGEHCVAIDTVATKVIANIPIGQTTQALVYVTNAAPSSSGSENLMPLGLAADTARLQLEPTGTGLSQAQASVAVNSLGLLDLLQIAAKGLTPRTSYQVFLAESNRSPFGKLEPLAVLKTNPDGAGIVQAIGPLKVLAGNDANSSPPQRFLIVTDIKDSSQVVLQQTDSPGNPSR